MQLRKQPVLFRAALALGFFLVFQSLLTHVVLSSFHSIRIQLETDHSDVLTVYYRSSERARFSEARAVRSATLPENRITRAKLPLHNHSARFLRIDPGSATAQLKLYRIQLNSRFGPGLVLSPEQIFEYFQPARDIAAYRLASDHVLLATRGADPQLIAIQALETRNTFIKWIFPALLSALLLLFMSGFDWRNFPAISDLSRDLTSNQLSYAALDGFRGIAVFLVVLDHTLGPFRGAGTAGVWMFFVLSGFLLSIPFVDHPDRAVSPRYMRHYLLRRLKRIVPMYYVYIVGLLLMHGRVGEDTIRHLLFLQGDGHLWTIQQEMLFYLVLPLILIANHLLFRHRLPWLIASLAMVTIASHLWLDQSVVSLYSEGASHPPYFGVFLCGILFSYLYHGALLKRPLPWLRTTRMQWLLSLVAISLLVLYVLLSTDLLFDRNVFLAQRHPGWFGLAAAVLLLLALLTSGSSYNRLLSWQPLRALGLVGYSFYLLHPVVIALLSTLQEYYLGYPITGLARLAIVLLLSYPLAAFTYTYLERPFLARR